MASESFGAEKGLPGREHRTGPLGDAMSDLRSDIDGAFETLEGVVGSIITGTTTIALGQSTKTVSAATLGGSYGGKPVIASLNTVDGTLLYLKAVAWSTNDLVITGNDNATAAVTVSYMIDNR